MANSPDDRNRDRSELISLIGYRGTGKSTVARKVAEHLGWTWVDADAELEQAAGRSIRGIFAEDGEAAFRDLECDTVERLVQRTQTVVAWGGGVVLREPNRRAIQRGWVFWLTADPSTIWARVDSDPSTSLRRPNLTTAGGIAEIEQLLAVREPLYRSCADCAVDTVGKSAEQVASEIVCFLQHRMPPLRPDHRSPQTP